MKGKKPIGLGLLLALAAMVAMAISASSAGAVVCSTNVLCSGGGTGAKIRDDIDSTAKFGADILAVNTKAPLRLRIKGFFDNQNPTGDAFFGLKVDKNPVAGCAAGNEFATGWVEFADIQNAKKEGNTVASPVYSGTAPVVAGGASGGFGPWPFKIRSDTCKTEPGVVTIENVNLFFPALGATAAGTITGVYEQPGTNCPGGGVKLNVTQTGLGAGREIDNGTEGQNAFLCFVSSNNVLFPTTPPTWTLTGSIWKD